MEAPKSFFTSSVHSGGRIAPPVRRIPKSAGIFLPAVSAWAGVVGRVVRSLQFPRGDAGPESAGRLNVSNGMTPAQQFSA